MSGPEIVEIVDSDDDVAPEAVVAGKHPSFINLFDDDHNDFPSKANANANEVDNAFQRQLQQAERASLESTVGATTTTTGKTAKKLELCNRVSLGQTPDNHNKNRRHHDSDDEDSDSDSSLLAYAGLIATRKKAPVATKTQAKKHINDGSHATPRQSAPPTRTYMAPHSASSVRSVAALTTPLANPYKSKASPASATSGASSSTAYLPVPLRNPYSSQKKKVPVATASAGRERNINGTAIFDDIEGSKESFPVGHAFPYPRLLHKSKQYPDLRPSYLLALWKYARTLTLHSHNRSTMDQTIAKVVRLSLSPHPIRSLEEFCVLMGGGSGSLLDFKNRKTNLQQHLDSGSVGLYQSARIPVGVNRDGLYLSIPEALLVSMATEVDRRYRLSSLGRMDVSRESLASNDMHISFEFLIPEIEKRLHALCPGRMQRKKDADGGLAYYLNKTTPSAEFLQIKKLELTCKGHAVLRNIEQNNGQEGYIKIRSSKKQVVFELLPLGYRTAKWIQQRSFPAPVSHYRTSRIGSLDQVDSAYKGICLAVDFREGGLQKSVLQNMCQGLDKSKVPYFVGALDIGDYAFFCTKTGKLCPVLIERKTIQDVAHSISDGRWTSQKHRMYHGQYVFEYPNCRMAYIIEGNIKKQLVAHEYVGHRKFNVTEERLEAAIKDLEAEGFDILRSSCPENSMFELSRWAANVARELSSLKIEYTYEEFKAKVKTINKETDFSRLAKWHMKKRQEAAKVAAMKVATEMTEDLDRKAAAKATQPAKGVFDLCDSDDDNDNNDNNKGNNATTKGLVPTSSVENDRIRPQGKRLEQNIPRKRNPMLKDSSASKANAIRSEHLLKPSKELESYFCDDSDGYGSDDSVLAKSRKLLAKSEKKRQKKRKRECLARSHQQSRTNNRSVQKPKEQRTTSPLKVDSKQAPEASSPGGDYEEWSSMQLQSKCEEYGLPKTGKKRDLIDRLKGPKPPKEWLERKKKGEYVPSRQNTAATAILVALYLHEKAHGNGGMTKDTLYAKAEGLDISKNPFSGGTTQTGKFTASAVE